MRTRSSPQQQPRSGSCESATQARVCPGGLYRVEDASTRAKVELSLLTSPPRRASTRTACGCKIETPRYACNLAPGCISSEPTFAGLRKKKKTRGPKKRGPRKKGKRGFLWQSLTSLEMQPGAKLQRISRGLYFAATRLHAAF